MATYTITKRNYLEEKINIELPYYSKNICFAYKVVNESQAVQVCYSDSDYGIKQVEASRGFDYDLKQITEAEYEELFIQTKDKINELNYN